MTRIRRFVVALLVVAGCAWASKPTLILISFDGFRADYFDRSKLPALHALAAHGVRVKALIPAFPTKTFPNHYTIVTGLYPEHHGIVANTMWDPEFDAVYTMSNPQSKQSRWYGGEPIWVTAEKQGQRTASYFWVGSDVPIEDTRPSYWKPYTRAVTSFQKIDTVLAWLDLPEDRRPTFLSAYFEPVDDAGHEFGPDGAQTLYAAEQVDSVIARLISGLQRRGLYDQVNVIVLADHGMSQLSPDRIIYLEDYIDSTDARVVDLSPIAALFVPPAKELSVFEKLNGKHPHLQVYRKADIPASLHYSQSRRIAPIIAIADDGWTIWRNRARKERKFSFGNHGYLPQSASMHALFVARGPAFKSGFVTERLENIHVYELVCHILGLTPAPNDGKFDAVKDLLR